MYAVIDIPRFALQAVLRMEEGLAGKPIALVDASLAKPSVIDCSIAAERSGIFSGLSLPQAIARCPEVVVRYRSEKAEVSAGRALFDYAYSLSPQVEETYPGVCTIGLDGVNRDGLHERCDKIVSALQGLGLKGRMGISTTPDLALLVARESKRVKAVGGDLFQGRVDCVSGVAMAKTDPHPVTEAGNEWPTMVAEPEKAGRPGLDFPEGVDKTEERALRLGSRSLTGPRYDSLKVFLHSLPLVAAEPSEYLHAILAQWGIHSAGAFVGLPREEVGKRLGKEGLDFWDRLSGREERPLRVSPLPECYIESLDFEYEIDTVGPLLFVIRRFLDSLCLRLSRSALVAETLNLELPLSDIRLDDGERVEAVRLSLKIPDPTCDADALFSLLSIRLENLDTAAAIVGISLEIEPVERNENQLGLFETSLKDPHRFSQTLAQLAGIVGPDNVGRPVLEADGRPDGVRLERLPSTIPPASSARVMDSFGMALRRFRPPLDADVRIRDRRPVWFRCSQGGGAIGACRGPWAHSSQWWEAGGWNRLEWDVELKAGGVYRLVKERSQWTVEGMYD